eukprot:763910-Hanusia_phi.AAC.2
MEHQKSGAETHRAGVDDEGMPLLLSLAIASRHLHCRSISGCTQRGISERGFFTPGLVHPVHRAGHRYSRQSDRRL